MKREIYAGSPPPDLSDIDARRTRIRKRDRVLAPTTQYDGARRPA
jgi:hypothetical protein